MIPRTKERRRVRSRTATCAGLERVVEGSRPTGARSQTPTTDAVGADRNTGVLERSCGTWYLVPRTATALARNQFKLLQNASGREIFAPSSWATCARDQSRAAKYRDERAMGGDDKRDHREGRRHRDNRHHHRHHRNQLVAGSVAGASTVAILYPLDVIKTRLQVQDGASHSLPQLIPTTSPIPTTSLIPRLGASHLGLLGNGQKAVEVRR